MVQHLSDKCKLFLDDLQYFNKFFLSLSPSGCYVFCHISEFITIRPAYGGQALPKLPPSLELRRDRMADKNPWLRFCYFV
jgi:hypothetical protein